MTEKKRTAVKENVFFAAVLLLTAVLSWISILYRGDDFCFYYARSIERYKVVLNPNGRWVGNFLTEVLVRNRIAGAAIYIVFFVTLVALTVRLASVLRPENCSAKWLVLGIFMLMPPALYVTTIAWLSPYGGYLLSVICIFIYLLLCARELSGKPVRLQIPAAALTLLLAVAGGLCVEHTTIYAFVLGIFTVILFAVRKDCKLRAFHICYAIGAAAAPVLMFLRGNYTDLAGGDDPTVGARSIETDFADILMNIYTEVAPMFIKHHLPILLVTAVSLLILLFRADRSKWDAARRRYVRVCTATVMLYAVYALFVHVYADLTVISWNMRVRAVEAAFLFLFGISLLYLCYVLLRPRAAAFAIFFLVSSVLLAAPFCMAAPVTPRCLFATYLFQTIFAVMLFCEALPERAARISLTAARPFALCAAALVLYTQLMNKYAMNLRVSYLKEQIAAGQKDLAVLMLPYPVYSMSEFVIYDSEEYKDLHPLIRLYFEGCMMYYDIELPEEYEYHEETLLNYFTET